MALVMAAADPSSGGTNWGGIILLVSAVLGSGGIGAFFKGRSTTTPAPSTDSGDGREDRLMDRYERRINTLEGRVTTLEDEAQDAVGYIDDLRQHIINGNPPPPPLPPNKRVLGM